MVDTANIKFNDCQWFSTLVSVKLVEPVYNDIGLRDTSSITSDIPRYQLIPHC
jgi:hypothetical protein